jgi:SnoaL-like domain
VSLPTRVVDGRRYASTKPAAPLVAAAVFNQSMLSLEEISDRLEIQQLLVDYSSAIDQRRFDDLDRVFTPDAYIDM